MPILTISDCSNAQLFTLRHKVCSTTRSAGRTVRGLGEPPSLPPSPDPPTRPPPPPARVDWDSCLGRFGSRAPWCALFAHQSSIGSVRPARPRHWTSACPTLQSQPICTSTSIRSASRPWWSSCCYSALHSKSKSRSVSIPVCIRTSPFKRLSLEPRSFRCTQAALCANPSG